MQVKFLTLNIWFGGKLFNNITSFIKKENPDIITFQEVYDGKNPYLEKRFQSYTLLQKVLGYQFVNFAPAFEEVLDVGNIEWGNAVFSKYPLISSENIFFDIPYAKNYHNTMKGSEFSPRNMQHVTLHADGKEIHVFNIHGIWGLDGNDNPRRRAMGEVIINHIRDKQHVILSGDFNLKPNTQTVYTIEKHLNSVFNNELQTTFNMKYKTNPGYATAAVDMIFVSKNIRVVKKLCPQIDISDHLPLIAFFEI